MATPYVAGTAALMLNGNPSLKGVDLKKIIYDQADDVSAFQGFMSTGKRINSLKAVQAALIATASVDQPQVPTGFTGQNAQNGSGDGGGGCGTIAMKSSSGDPPSNNPFLLCLLLPFLMIASLRLRVKTIPLAPGVH